MAQGGWRGGGGGIKAPVGLAVVHKQARLLMVTAHLFILYSAWWRCALGSRHL